MYMIGSASSHPARNATRDESALAVDGACGPRDPSGGSGKGGADVRSKTELAVLRQLRHVARAAVDGIPHPFLATIPPDLRTRLERLRTAVEAADQIDLEDPEPRRREHKHRTLIRDQADRMGEL